MGGLPITTWPPLATRRLPFICPGCWRSPILISLSGAFSSPAYLNLLSDGQEVPPRVHPLLLLLFILESEHVPGGTSEII